jgi:hypothetical protein
MLLLRPAFSAGTPSSGPITYADLKALIEQARVTGLLQLSVDKLGSSLVEPFRIALGDVKLELKDLRIPFIDDKEIVVHAATRVGSIRIAAEFRFFNSGGAVDYAVSFATSNWKQMLDGTLSSVAKIVPIETLWWTVSSITRDAMRIQIPRFDLDPGRIVPGDAYRFLFDSAVLRRLGLGKAVFLIEQIGDKPRFNLAVKMMAKLPPILAVAVSRVSFNSGGIVEVEGQAELSLLGLKLNTPPGLLVFSPDKFSLRIPVPEQLDAPAQLFFRGIKLSNNEVSLNGSLSGSYSVGMAGDFVINGSGHRGTYEFQYVAPNQTLPDLVELSADTLTLSDALTLMSGFTISLPAALERVVVLRNAYFYYATRDGLTTRSKVSSQRGASVHADVSILGYSAYLGIDARQDDVVARLLMNPIRLGDVLALRGKGGAPPQGYKGQAIVPEAIALVVDTGRQYARGSIQVDFGGRELGFVDATLAGESLSCDVGLRLPPPLNSTMLGVVVSKQSVCAKADFAFVEGIRINLFRGFELSGQAAIEGKLIVDAPMNGQASSSVIAKLKLGVFEVSTQFNIDPKDVVHLAKRVVAELLKAAQELLKDALAWLKAYLGKAIKYVLHAADELRNLAATLAETFKVGVNQAVRLLNQAGAAASYALDLVREGGALIWGSLNYANVLSTFRKIFPEQEVVDAVRHWGEQLGKAASEIVQETAEAVAWLLREGGFAVEKIAAEVRRYFKEAMQLEKFANALAFGRLKPTEVASALQKLGGQIATAEAVGKILGKLFGTDKTMLQQALSPVYGAAVAKRVTDDVARELGHIGGSVGKEVKKKVCNWLGIC